MLNATIKWISSDNRNERWMEFKENHQLLTCCRSTDMGSQCGAGVSPAAIFVCAWPSGVPPVNCSPVSNRLKQKWALVTGASSGFGAETARQLADLGANLLLGARREDRLAQVAAECQERGAASAHIQRLDVSDTVSVNSFAEWAKATAGRVNVLINNAGGAHGVDRVEDGHDADWEAMFQSNALGILRVTRAMLPLMKPYSGGIIINVGSIAGRVAYEGGSAYCASKAAEHSITKTLRLELNGTGLRVGTIDPGMAETEFSMVRLKGDKQKADAVYAGVEPLTAGDVAEAIVWAANRPPHVCIDEILMMCTAQAAPYKVHRTEA